MTRGKNHTDTWQNSSPMSSHRGLYTSMFITTGKQNCDCFPRENKFLESLFTTFSTAGPTAVNSLSLRRLYLIRRRFNNTYPDRHVNIIIENKRGKPMLRWEIEFSQAIGGDAP